MSKHTQERDVAAGQTCTGTISGADLGCNTCYGFKAGWDAALLESSVVKGLIEMIKGQQELLSAYRLGGQPREWAFKKLAIGRAALEAYELACKEIK